ncbi:sulfatase family protein [Thalassotalea sp. PLHSN55]|uniref:sulfatase family protein n=1 Tax=Thalassotalea sp. PLHSN55 TaxID=3435888 RepID=UPI003F83B5E3
MNKYTYLSLVALLSAPLVSCSVVETKTEPTRSAATKQYNILYIMSDDHAAQAIGTYQGRLAKLNPTPNLDKLGNEGMVFDNVFVTNSICSPSRATILTGQYSQTNGVQDLKGGVAGEKQYLPIEMKKAGYETAIVGKWHLKKEPSAFDFYQVLPGQGKYFDPEFRVRGDEAWPNNIKTSIGHSSDVITDTSIKWLKNRKSDKPFFLMHQFKAPHDYFQYATRYNHYLDDVEIPEPADLYGIPDTFGSPATRGHNDELIREIGTSISKRNPRRNYGQHYKIDPNLSDKEYTYQAYQAYVKGYLRTIKGVDDNIARLIQTLKDEGLYENTIIVYTSDQGMMLGEHDYQDKRWIWDESIQMPFIVKHPEIEKSGQRSDLLINNTDFAPFILDLANKKTPSYMQGRSFKSELLGETPDNWRTASLYRYWTHRMYHDVPAHTGLRTKEFKLIFFYGDNYRDEQFTYYDKKWLAKTGKQPNKVATPAGWELYDLRSDPNELHNVYNDKRYQSVIKELKQELVAQRKRYNETDVNYPRMQKIFQDSFNN